MHCVVRRRRRRRRRRRSLKESSLWLKRIEKSGKKIFFRETHGVRAFDFGRVDRVDRVDVASISVVVVSIDVVSIDETFESRDLLFIFARV